MVLAATALLISLGGCGHKVGDACTNSADCDPSGGTRTCDLSQPGGYCIVDGCDARSCPSDSVCARFFPEQPLLPVKVCDATAVPPAPTGCDADEICLPDANVGAASCVRAALEKRACVETCGSDGDCRGGYVCQALGMCGNGYLTLNPAVIPKYCAPAPLVPLTADGGLCPLNTAGY
jgi:hypothetical protein